MPRTAAPSALQALAPSDIYSRRPQRSENLFVRPVPAHHPLAYVRLTPSRPLPTRHTKPHFPTSRTDPQPPSAVTSRTNLAQTSAPAVGNNVFPRSHRTPHFPYALHSLPVDIFSTNIVPPRTAPSASPPQGPFHRGFSGFLPFPFSRHSLPAGIVSANIVPTRTANPTALPNGPHHRGISGFFPCGPSLCHRCTASLSRPPTTRLRTDVPTDLLSAAVFRPTTETTAIQ